MKKKHVLSVFIIFIIMLFNVTYAADSEVTKKIISIVYDDSGSMMGDNNYCYSDYALQILTATLEKNDELNIVKMSEYYQNNEINLSTQTQKQNYIDEIRGFTHNGGTPFESVNTARDWLINQSKKNGDSADYWLVVITDGAFAGLPSPLNTYFDDINSEFNNLNYEFVLLSIGGYTDYELKNVVTTTANSNLITANDKDGIYDSMLEIANMINNGASDKIVTAEKNGDKKIKAYSKYPLKKMMILMQNTENEIKSIKQDGSILKIENYNVEYPIENLQGLLTQVINEKDNYLNAGYYEIEFNEKVDMSRLTFLCEVLVECKISIVDEDDKVLNNAQLNFLTSDKKVRVKCELFNSADGTKLNLDGDKENIEIQLINDKNKYNMTYDSSKNAYYAEVTLVGKNNNIYALTEAKDLFRIKSNVIFIDTVAGKANIEKYENNMAKIEVPYSSSKDYEKVGQFSFSFVEETEYNVAEDFELQVIDLPDGIRFEYDGKEYKNNDKIPMIKEFGKSYVLNLLVNKDYDEVEDVAITLKLLSENNTIYWTTNGVDEEYIVITPKSYPLRVINKHSDPEIDVEEEVLELSIIKVLDETSLTVVGYVNVEDIKKIEDNSSFGTGFTYKVKKDKDSNTLKVEFKPNIFALFNDKNIDIELNITFDNNKETANYKENITLTNINVWDILKPYVIALIALIILIGYVAKKKFNRKSQITITENGERVSYALKPSIETILIPYVAHKTKIGMIEFKAGKNNEIIYSGKNLEILKIDGEALDVYKETNNFNVEKIIMKKDFSSVNINAFDVEQKYEYLTKEVDVGSYTDDYSDSYSDDGYGDEYTDSDYMDDNQF